MSSAAPFNARGGFFPFCSSLAEELTDTSYDAVDFPETDGDAGLTAAMRAYWLLEKLALSPSGTLTEAGPGGGSWSYGKTFTFPDPATSQLLTYSLRGAMGSQQLSGGSLTMVGSLAPGRRVCGPLDSGADANDIAVASFIYGTSLVSSDRQDLDQLRLRVAYDGTRWRMQYRFVFSIQGVTAINMIANPATAMAPPYVAAGSGIITVAGCALNWEARVVDDPDYSFTGAGLSVAQTDYSIP
jgi:hypothetical protein